MRLKYELCRCKCESMIWKNEELCRLHSPYLPYPPWPSGSPTHCRRAIASKSLLLPVNSGCDHCFSIRPPHPLGALLHALFKLALPLTRNCRLLGILAGVSGFPTFYRNALTFHPLPSLCMQYHSFNASPRPNRASHGSCRMGVGAGGGGGFKEGLGAQLTSVIAPFIDMKFH